MQIGLDIMQVRLDIMQVGFRYNADRIEYNAGIMQKYGCRYTPKPIVKSTN